MAERTDYISCSQLVELVTEYLEGAMSAEQQSLFEEHLNYCDGCVSYVDQLQQTIELVGELREEDIPVEAKERLLTVFAEWGRR